jgi:hypothetical protein
VVLGRKAKPGDKAVIFIDREPAVLADVLAESLFAYSLQDLLVEATVSAIKMINAFGHNKRLYYLFYPRLASRAPVENS